MVNDPANVQSMTYDAAITKRCLSAKYGREIAVAVRGSFYAAPSPTGRTRGRPCPAGAAPHRERERGARCGDVKQSRCPIFRVGPLKQRSTSRRPLHSLRAAFAAMGKPSAASETGCASYSSNGSVMDRLRRPTHGRGDFALANWAGFCARCFPGSLTTCRLMRQSACVS